MRYIDGMCVYPDGRVKPHERYAEQKECREGEQRVSEAEGLDDQTGAE